MSKGTSTPNLHDSFKVSLVKDFMASDLICLDYSWQWPNMRAC